MKKNILFLTLIFGVLLSFSCNKKETAQTPRAERTEIDGGAQAQVSGIRNQSYVMLVGSWLYPLEADTGAETDKINPRQAVALSLGESIRTGEIRRATSTNGVVYDFIEVKRDDGREGYAFATQIAVGGRLAVVVEDGGAKLHRSPKTVDVSGVILSRKTIVVYNPETESGGFVEVKAYDPERKSYVPDNNKYVRVSSLSTRTADIQSSILWQTAEPLKNEGAEKVRKDALLESALLDYPNSVFYNEILAIANPNMAGVLEDGYPGDGDDFEISQ